MGLETIVTYKITVTGGSGKIWGKSDCIIRLGVFDHSFKVFSGHRIFG